MTEITIDYSQEIWKPVIGYEELYAVSNIGRVKSLDRYYERNGFPVVVRERIRKLFKYNGYSVLNLNNQGRAKNYKVHRLVASAFIGESSLFIDHINDDRGDNRLENLRYVTNRENNKYVKSQKELLNVQKVYTKKGTLRWSVTINNGPKRKFVGNFDTLEEAIMARDHALHS